MSITYQRTREMTIDELMLENRTIFLIGEINPGSAARLMMQMLYLENQKRGQDIHFYINSPGGAVDDTLALYDTMRFIASPVNTVPSSSTSSALANGHRAFVDDASAGDGRADDARERQSGERRVLALRRETRRVDDPCR